MYLGFYKILIFLQNVLKTHSGSFLISLGERLINDEEPEIRKIIAQCISSMLQKLTKQDRDPLFEIVLLWFKDKNVSTDLVKNGVRLKVCENGK